MKTNFNNMKLKSKKRSTSTKAVGVARKLNQEFKDNLYRLQGSAMAILNVIKNTEDTKLVTDSFDWLMDSFEELPTDLGEANPNLIFPFFKMFTGSENDYRQLKFKIAFALKENDYDENTIGWFMQDLEL
jgi:hypothetical protein